MFRAAYYGILLGVTGFFLPAAAGAGNFYSYYDPAADISELSPGLLPEEAAAVLGSFHADASASTALEYTDNVALTDGGAKSDLGTTNTARLTLSSDWERHALSVGVGGAFTRFKSQSSENQENYYGFADGRFDVGGETALIAGLAHHEQTEARDAPFAPAGLSERREFGTSSAYLGFRYEGVLLASGKSAWKRTNFHSTIDSRDFDYEDRENFRHSLRIGYPLTEEFSVFIEPAFGTERYDGPDPTGITRDSDARELLAGVDYRFSDITRLEAGIGRIWRDFDDARLADASGTAVNAALSWQGLDELLVKAAITRSIDGTTLAGVNDIETLGALLLANYKLSDDWQLRALAGWDQYDFSGTTRQDEVLTLGLGMDYRITDNVVTGLDYRRRLRDSSANGFDFTSNVILWTLAFAF